MLSPQIPVAKEGLPFIALSAFITLICAILGYSCLTTIAFIATAFILYFFRDPERFIPERSDALVAPADGKIILIEDVSDTAFTQAQAYKISIFMNVFNVHVNRIPCDGKVERVMYAPGNSTLPIPPKGPCIMSIAPRF